MKVLLVKPWGVSDTIAPLLGLGYLGAALTPAHEPQVLDCYLERISPRQFGEWIKPEKPAIVGFQLHTFEKPLVKNYLEATRKALPEAVTVVGGPHPTAAPEDVFNAYGPLLDFAIRCEAEKGILQLADLVSQFGRDVSTEKLKQVAGLVYKKGEEIFQNPEWIAPAEQIGAPRWDLLTPDKYPQRPPGAFFQQFPTAPISISRGCPHPCTFCAANMIMGRKIRYRPVDSVISEIAMLHEEYGIREIYIMDDNFTVDRNYVLEFCRRLSGLDLGITWTCPNGVRLDTLDDELLSAMKKSGCYSLSVGIESGSRRVLNAIGKTLTLSTIEEKVALIKNHSLSVKGFFILGFPGETESEMEATLRLSRRLPLDIALFSMFHPFPGTKIYDDLVAQGLAGQIRSQANTLAEVAYVPQGMTAAQLKRKQRKAFILFWLRPRILLFFIHNIRSTKHLWFLTRRMLRWFVSK